MEEGATIRIWRNCLHIRICAELFLGPDNKVYPFLQFMRFSRQVCRGGLPFPPPLLLGRKAMENLDSVLRSRDITLPTKVHISQSYGLPSGQVWLWELEHKESGTQKNWCLRTVVLEKTPESPLNSKEINLVNLKGIQPWILVGRTDAEVETPAFWSSNVNSWLIVKVPDAGKDWGQKEKRASEDEMAGWHHQCNGYKLEQTLGGAEACSAAVHGVAKSWKQLVTEQ